MKKLYFTSDFSKENVEKLKATGWVLRNAAIPSEHVEHADVYGGDLPKRYLDAGKVAYTDPKPKPKKEVAEE